MLNREQPGGDLWGTSGSSSCRRTPKCRCTEWRCSSRRRGREHFVSSRTRALRCTAEVELLASSLRASSCHRTPRYPPWVGGSRSSRLRRRARPRHAPRRRQSRVASAPAVSWRGSIESIQAWCRSPWLTGAVGTEVSGAQEHHSRYAQDQAGPPGQRPTAPAIRDRLGVCSVGHAGSLLSHRRDCGHRKCQRQEHTLECGSPSRSERKSPRSSRNATVCSNNCS